MMLPAAVFSAVIAVCSQIAIPLAPVPVNLGVFAVFLAAGLLGPGYGALSVIVYILLGIIGIPVFAGFRGGPGAIMGPTGGYITGYIFTALVSGRLLEREGDGAGTVRTALSLLCGLAVCYLAGTVWFYIVSGWDIGRILISCVVIFLPGDAAKIILASLLIKKVRPLVEKYLI